MAAQLQNLLASLLLLFVVFIGLTFIIDGLGGKQLRQWVLKKLAKLPAFLLKLLFFPGYALAYHGWHKRWPKWKKSKKK
jgi:hypothetical protein